MQESKTLILHDTFLYKWGGERLILMMWKALNADIASWFFSEGSFDLRKEWFTWKIIPVSSEIFAKGFRHIKLKWSFIFSTKFITQYDTVLFSGDSISAVRNCSKETKKIYYCHTPPRYIYDLHDLYLKKVKWYLRPIFKLSCSVFKFLYERDLKKIDLILTNSENTKSRIKKYLWYDSEVLYPPVDTKRFVWLWQKWYFLSFARLADAKRVDRIVEAFTQIPNEKLIVIYGKNDPQREKIFELAKWYKNIELITLDDNDLLYDYIGYARATIYVPIDEDFGMSPVESMSAGKPVLWVNDGGLKETIIHKETGYLIDAQCNVKDIISAVEYMSPEKCFSMQWTCESQAWKFWLSAFEKQLKTYI
jgi:glycosyltransferase involved in cell wall biosynthesis